MLTEKIISKEHLLSKTVILCLKLFFMVNSCREGRNYSHSFTKDKLLLHSFSTGWQTGASPAKL